MYQNLPEILLVVDWPVFAFTGPFGLGDNSHVHTILPWSGQRLMAVSDLRQFFLSPHWVLPIVPLVGPVLDSMEKKMA